jgi:hypothetical protein
MIFIDNKYTRIYYAIIDRAQTRPLPEHYTEKHHIIPQSFYKSRSKTGWLLGDYNSKKNIAVLTAREHFVCHMLLVKMTDGLAHYKMTFALKRSAHGKYIRQYINSRTYEYIKKINSEAMKGRPCSPETREKIRRGNLNRQPTSEQTRRKLSAAAKRRKGLSPEGLAKIIESSKNRVCSEETKQKLREARAQQVAQGSTMSAESRAKLSSAAKGRVLSKDHKNKIGEANKGKVRSKETKKQMSKLAQARMTKEMKQILREKCKATASKEPKPQVTCPHCGKVGGEPTMKRWHFDQCASKEV